MTKKDIIDSVSETTGTSKKETEATIDALLNVIKEEIKAGEKVTLFGFGNFEPKTNAARAGINPQTKEPIQIKASNSVKFKPGKAFKDYLN